MIIFYLQMPCYYYFFTLLFLWTFDFLPQIFPYCMATTLSKLDITCTKRNLIFKRSLSHFCLKNLKTKSLRVIFLQCEQPTNYEWMQPAHFQIQISFKILFGTRLCTLCIFTLVFLYSVFVCIFHLDFYCGLFAKCIW